MSRLLVPLAIGGTVNLLTTLSERAHLRDIIQLCQSEEGTAS